MPTIRLALLVAVTFVAIPAAAQQPTRNADRGQDRARDAQGIPPGHLPPPGECRVWYDARPAGQQPPPTNCAAAREQASRTGGRVIFGGEARRDDRRDDDRGRGRDERRECDEKDRAKGECGRDDRRDPTDDRRDRDGDRRDPNCIDRNSNSRCDADERTYPGSLPEMVWGVAFPRGEYVEDTRYWVGADAVRARYTDADRNGVPEVVSWYLGKQLVQRWADTNRDGRADRVSIYENGKVVRVVQ